MDSGLPPWLLYGATGYTGELIAREAVKRGERPILAGRNAEAVGRLGSELNCPVRIAALDDPVALAKMLSEVGVLLNCAGPFAQTAPALIDACIAAKVHYLDVTGELDVIELAARRGEAAAAAGVTLMPAVGFDVVPSDCLAAMLKERCPAPCGWSWPSRCKVGSAGGRPRPCWLPCPAVAGCAWRAGSSRCRWASKRSKSPFATAPAGR